MSEAETNHHNETEPSPETEQVQSRRLFLQGVGKWSGAAITAAVAGTWLASRPKHLVPGSTAVAVG